jgi:hypothetical protein
MTFNEYGLLLRVIEEKVMVKVSVPSSEDTWNRYKHYPKSERYDLRTWKKTYYSICHYLSLCVPLYNIRARITVVGILFCYPPRCHSFHRLFHASICPSSLLDLFLSLTKTFHKHFAGFRVHQTFSFSVKGITRDT